MGTVAEYRKRQTEAMGGRCRINTAVPKETYDFIRSYADRFGMTMGSAIAVILDQYRMQQNVSQGFAAISDRGFKVDK